MKKIRFTTKRVVGFIKRADAGMAAPKLARQNRFSQFYAWRASHGGMEAAAIASASPTAAITRRPFSQGTRQPGLVVNFV